ncbi:MAG: hypothetical protein NVSMB37_4030 [Candidatus Saccharimonadales bacterium]
MTVLKSGKFQRPYLGVRYVTLTDDYAYYYNLSIKRGAYIAPSTSSQSPIISGSPAEKAGLQVKDVITKIDGTAIDDSHTLSSLLGKHSVGDDVTLTVSRAGKEQDIKIKLEAQPTN